MAPAITLDTAQTYANALLTAGVTDALVRVAAPTAQPALGTTALLGLLRAAQATCVPLDPARVRLALREAVVAAALRRPQGWAARGPPLLFALKRAATTLHPLTPAVLAALITRTAAPQHVTVPATLQPALATYLHDLASAGAYAGIAARTSVVTGATLADAAIHLAAMPVPAASPRDQPTAGTAPRPTGRGVARDGRSPPARPAVSRSTSAAEDVPTPQRREPPSCAMGSRAAWARCSRTMSSP